MQNANLKAGVFVAFRYLWGRGGEGGRYLQGAAMGIALSLIPIIITLIVADGMIRGITDRYLELGTGHLQVFNFGSPQTLESAHSIILEQEGVRGVWAEQHGLGVIVGSRGKTGATIRAIESSFWEDEGSAKYLRTISGEAKISSDREVLLGEALAQSIGAEVGKNIRIMTLRVTEDGRNIPRTTIFTVKGIISSGYRELDALWCVMSYSAGKDILPPRSSSSFLIVKINEPYHNIDEKVWMFYSALGGGFTVYTWKQIQRSLYSSYESTRQLLLFIMGLIVLIAAVNVSSATSMLTIERQRDIAVLKANGASPSVTTRIFLWASCLTGFFGAVIGIGLGLFIGNFINPIIHGLENILGIFSPEGKVTILDPGYYLENIPIIINWTVVFFIGFFTVLCSVVASWIPAYGAGKTKPLDILRKY